MSEEIGLAEPGAPACIDPGMWRKVCEQTKHVKAAARDLHAANAEVRECRKDLDKASERLIMLIEQTENGQTQLFDAGGKPDEPQGTAETAEEGEEQGEDLDSGEAMTGDAEGLLEDAPEADPASLEATQD